MGGHLAEQVYIYLAKCLESIIQPRHSGSVGRATDFRLEDCGFKKLKFLFFSVRRLQVLSSPN